MSTHQNLLPVRNAEKTFSPSHRVVVIVASLLILIATGMRIIPSAGFIEIGFDEWLYRNHLLMLDHGGLLAYPEICQVHIENQRDPAENAKLPPTRFLYIFSGWIWKLVEFGDAPSLSISESGFAQRDPALVSLHRVSCLFSVLFVLLCGAAAYRMLGPMPMLSVLALVGTSPISVHMGQHALIDGFFAFWATLCVWTLWENLKQPRKPWWLLAYGLALMLLVMTKENSFFVVVGLTGLIVMDRWFRFGEITPALLAVTVAGPAIGVLLLMNLAGGPGAFFEIYRLLVVKAQTLEYAIQTGDGPWYRYLVDLMIVNPLVLCLAIAAFFSQLRKHPAYLYLAAFVVITYLLMCNVRYAMNLRYATVWELPLAALAAAHVDELARVFKRKALVTALLLAGLSVYGLRQYLIFFADGALYEIATSELLRAVKILK